IALLEKGISSNEDDWRLYQDLGYIYWQAGNAATGAERIRDYQRAGDWYSKGGQIPGSMWWMRDLGGLMRIKGGSREAALVIYTGYLNSDDPMIRSQAEGRLKQLRSLDELDRINALLTQYRNLKGTCPKSLRVFAERFAALGLTLNEQFEPVDPDGFPYEYDSNECVARLVLKSTVMR